MWKGYAKIDTRTCNYIHNCIYYYKYQFTIEVVSFPLDTMSFIQAITSYKYGISILWKTMSSRGIFVI